MQGKKKGIEKKGLGFRFRVLGFRVVTQFGNKHRPHEYCSTLTISA